MTQMVLRKSVDVPCGVTDAFALFTEGISTWWPLQTHSVGQAHALSCAIEGRVGGRIYETMADGNIEVWGTVTLWEPPDALEFTWHPGRDPSTAQRVSIRFEAVSGGTRIFLEHRGWEVLGDAGSEAYASYERGWEVVLGGDFAAAARATATARR
jgi:hypothetical protein